MELMVNLYECKNFDITGKDKENAEKLGLIWYTVRGIIVPGGPGCNFGGIIMSEKYEGQKPVYLFKHQVKNKTKLYKLKHIRPVEPYKDLRYTALEFGSHGLKIEVRGSNILHIKYEFMWSDRIAFNPTELFIKRATHAIGYF